jgi:hypothetical protein
MSIFSAAELEGWERDGYVVLRNAVTQDQVDAVVDAMWAFLEMDRATPADWYAWPAWHRPRSGMVQLFHDQSMWDVRQTPRIHAAFAELYGTERLLVSLDRLNMNPPALPHDDYQGNIHWDIDPLAWPEPLKCGGVLCLADTSADQGGFQCVPGSHRRVAQIVAEIPPGRPLRLPEVPAGEIVPIPGNAGDLIIWNVGLLHSSSRNRTDRPRVAQYVTMVPEHYVPEAERQERIEHWRHNTPPYNEQGFVADPRGIEQAKGAPAQLTDLGRRLLGLDAWA